MINWVMLGSRPTGDEQEQRWDRSREPQELLPQRIPPCQALPYLWEEIHHSFQHMRVPEPRASSSMEWVPETRAEQDPVRVLEGLLVE